MSKKLHGPIEDRALEQERSIGFVYVKNLLSALIVSDFSENIKLFLSVDFVDFFSRFFF